MRSTRARSSFSSSTRARSSFSSSSAGPDIRATGRRRRDSRLAPSTPGAQRAAPAPAAQAALVSPAAHAAPGAPARQDSTAAKTAPRISKRQLCRSTIAPPLQHAPAARASSASAAAPAQQQHKQRQQHPRSQQCPPTTSTGSQVAAAPQQSPTGKQRTRALAFVPCMHKTPARKKNYPLCLTLSAPLEE